MFKQITDLNGDESYLIFSLLMFMVFFLLVGIMLVRMKKDYADEMSQMPLEENYEESFSNISDYMLIDIMMLFDYNTAVSNDSTIFLFLDKIPTHSMAIYAFIFLDTL